MYALFNNLIYVVKKLRTNIENLTYLKEKKILVAINVNLKTLWLVNYLTLKFDQVVGIYFFTKHEFVSSKYF